MISLIICTYNRRHHLRLALESAAQLTPPPGNGWELLVVDNNSSDGTKECVADFASQSKLNVRYVFEEHQGLAWARNRGISEANGDVIVFTDDDVVLDRSWLAEISSAFQRFDCAAAGGRILPLWEGPEPDWYDARPGSVLRPVVAHFDLGDCAGIATDFPYGANMAFRKAVFAQIGLFRTDLGRIGNGRILGEESELMERLVAAGGSIIYVPSAIVHHRVPKARATKAYCRSWYFGKGRTNALAETLPPETVRYFGIPRYLLPKLLTTTLGWLFSADSAGRFRCRLRMSETAGEIVEFRRLARRSAAARTEARSALRDNLKRIS